MNRLPVKTGELAYRQHDGLVPYPSSRRVNWCLSEGCGDRDQRPTVGPCGLRLERTTFCYIQCIQSVIHSASPAADQFQTRQTLLSGDLFSTARLPC